MHIAAVAVVVGAVMVLITGCPKQTDTEVAKTETTVQPAPPEATPGETKAAEPAAPEEGKQLLQQRCTQCHTTDRIKKEKQEADAEEWHKIVKEMQGKAERKKKTPITDEEAAKILDYVINAPAL